MQVIGIIPARYGSTRFPGKPLADILGRPMIQWVYEGASKAKLDVLMVATDDERIFAAVEKFGGRAVMTSSAHVSGTDRIAEVMKRRKEDIVVNIQGDEPLIRHEMINAAVLPLRRNREIMMSTIVTRLENPVDMADPDIVKVVMDKESRALYFSRSGIPYQAGERSKIYKHTGLYVYRRNFLLKFAKMKPAPLEKAEKLEQLRVLENGYPILVVETEYNSVPVDTPDDIEKIKEILKKNENRQDR